MITLICATMLLMTCIICYTTVRCIYFKYRTVEQTQAVSTKEDIQETIDKEREKNKVPTMEDLVLVAQRLIGGDEDGE